MVLGPCNTVTANVVAPNRRAAAYATFIFFIHLLGDISSPILLGWISELFGKQNVMDSSIGQFFTSIGATPVGSTNLTVAMLSVGADLGARLSLFRRRLDLSAGGPGESSRRGRDRRGRHCSIPPLGSIALVKTNHEA